MDTTVRQYGRPPFTVAVLHGGPGAPGYVAPVARELSRDFGVVEPLQTRDSLDGQIVELSEHLAAHASGPCALIGSSWGALLALFAAARYPERVSRLVLVGCGVFDAESSATIQPRRLERLSEADRVRCDQLVAALSDAPAGDRDGLMEELGSLLSRADMFDPLPDDSETIEVQYDLHCKVWDDFKALRDEPGRLEDEFAAITASATIIHGDYDPHPLTGIQPFLESALPEVDVHVLGNCGHYPWRERHARDVFYGLLRSLLAR
ncbi:alpha/beta fold hydrolase [candidate division GN15 bacterium]|nr:alpha/beta fold hydrolase [candidate division GN15 bacterium]